MGPMPMMGPTGQMGPPIMGMGQTQPQTQSQIGLGQFGAINQPPPAVPQQHSDSSESKAVSYTKQVERVSPTRLCGSTSPCRPDGPSAPCMLRLLPPVLLAPTFVRARQQCGVSCSCRVHKQRYRTGARSGGSKRATMSRSCTHG